MRLPKSAIFVGVAMNRTLLATCLATALVAAAAHLAPAQEAVTADQGAVAREMQQDVVLRALVDELQRSHAELKLEGFDRPYYIEYGLTDLRRAEASAQL